MSCESAEILSSCPNPAKKCSDLSCDSVDFCDGCGSMSITAFLRKLPF